MKISCDVIRDLLPLYADSLASETSSRLVEDHVKECPQCRRLMEQMRMPMEQEPEDEERAYLDAIRAQKRKTRRNIVIAVLLPFLLIGACVIGWWLYMETHFNVETLEVVSTNEEWIRAQMPRLAPSQAEKDLAQGILTDPVIMEVRSSTELIDEIPLERVEPLIAGVLPQDASEINVSATEDVVYIEYWSDGLRFILSYGDGDRDGKVDLIRKTIAIPESEENRAADVIYGMEYVPVVDRAYYEKLETKHVWFGFLDMS